MQPDFDSPVRNQHNEKSCGLSKQDASQSQTASNFLYVKTMFVKIMFVKTMFVKQCLSFKTMFVQDHCCRDHVCPRSYLSRPCLSRPCWSSNVCQDHVCHNDVCPDHVCQEPVCQEHVCQEHVFQEHVCQICVCQDYFFNLGFNSSSKLRSSDPIWSRSNQFDPIWSKMNKFDLFWYNFIKLINKACKLAGFCLKADVKVTTKLCLGLVWSSLPTCFVKILQTLKSNNKAMFRTAWAELAVKNQNPVDRFRATS